LQYAEGWFSEQSATEAAETVTLPGPDGSSWEVQRRCPHLKADLSRFASISDGGRQGAVLTCQMHGWVWRLSDGKCISSTGGNALRCGPAGAPVPSAAAVHHDPPDGLRGQHEMEESA
jgi:UDP-MurNAc hydroxylase